MLRPATPRPASASRSTACGGSRSTPAAPGGASGWWRAAAAGRPRDARAGQLQRHLRRRRGARPRRRRLVPDASCACRAAGPGERIVLRFDAATHRAVVWVDDDAGRRARGRLHAVRGRRHRASCEPGAENRVTVVVNNELTWQSIPPGHRRGHARRRRGSATSTTSSTTPACTARCGCTPRRASHVSDVTVVTGLDGTTGTVALPRSTPPATAPRSASSLRDADGRRGRARRPAPTGELTRRRRAPVAPGRGLPLRPRRRAVRRRRRVGRQLPAAGRHPHRARSTARGS